LGPIHVHSERTVIFALQDDEDEEARRRSDSLRNEPFELSLFLALRGTYGRTDVSGSNLAPNTHIGITLSLLFHPGIRHPSKTAFYPTVAEIVRSRNKFHTETNLSCSRDCQRLFGRVVAFLCTGALPVIDHVGEDQDAKGQVPAKRSGRATGTPYAGNDNVTTCGSGMAVSESGSDRCFDIFDHTTVHVRGGV
jgi:hypothetical protein